MRKLSIAIAVAMCMWAYGCRAAHVPIDDPLPAQVAEYPDDVDVATPETVPTDCKLFHLTKDVVRQCRRACRDFLRSADDHKWDDYRICRSDCPTTEVACR